MQLSCHQAIPLRKAPDFTGGFWKIPVLWTQESNDKECDYFQLPFVWEDTLHSTIYTALPNPGILPQTSPSQPISMHPSDQWDVQGCIPHDLWNLHPSWRCDHQQSILQQLKFSLSMLCMLFGTLFVAFFRPHLLSTLCLFVIVKSCTKLFCCKDSIFWPILIFKLKGFPSISPPCSNIEFQQLFCSMPMHPQIPPIVDLWWRKFVRCCFAAATLKTMLLTLFKTVLQRLQGYCKSLFFVSLELSLHHPNLSWWHGPTRFFLIFQFNKNFE